MNLRILRMLLLAVLSIVPVQAETLTVAVIRVGFQADDSPATAGNGSFIMSDETGLVCSEWVLDPPPHNSAYFLDHIKAANNYWEKVSAGAVNIDTTNSTVFPTHPDSVYTLPNDMLYYQPYLEDFDETEKLMELAQHAIELADPDIDFRQFTTVILVHAGMGGDFAFALDPTPGNIPSAYLSQTDFASYGAISTNEKVLDDIIIIPESQNFMQYDETRALFEDSDDPCFYQVGLNGTIALMLGFHLDLPPMYDTETGQSLLGGFALMDQGSNNFHGIVPAYPNPYTRVKQGWATPVEKHTGDNVSLHVNDDPILISITDSEYYLIENRQRNVLDPGTMATWIDTLVGDTVSVITGKSGVVVAVDEQHAGLPGNGLYIWHIDEDAEHTSENPNGGTYQLVDFVEADGAQDMGHESQLIFADYLETGWWFDPWFAENEGWHHLNRDQDTIHFSSGSFPSTQTNSGLDTYLRIGNISPRGSIMSFSIRSDRVIDSRNISRFLGWGHAPGTIWGLSADGSVFESYGFDADDDLSLIKTSTLSPDSIFTGSIDSNFLFRYPWVAPDLSSGIKLFSILDNQQYWFADLDSLFELRLDPDSQGVQFFAEAIGGYSNVHVANGQSTQSTVVGHPLTDFGQPGQSILIDPINQYRTFKPFSVVNGDIRSGARVIVDWTAEEQPSAITLSTPGELSTRFFADAARHMIPVDPDDDGIFEIALFYDDEVRIVNQAGSVWNGSPFNIDTFYGNPIIAPFTNGKVGIFLRHTESYTIYSFEGELLDRGLLSEISSPVVNEARIVANTTYMLSGNELLYFPEQSDIAAKGVWLEEQGDALGTRTLVLSGTPSLSSSVAREGSVYNYPNPVKGQSTTIRAWLGDINEWSIEIFSINGSQIAYEELDVAQQHAYNEWVWDASSVSNGVYMVQIVAGDMAEIFKIAVIR